MRRTLSLALIIAVAALGWLWLSGGISGSPETIRSIAVLPLTNLTGDREQDYFVDGLTEELTAEIMRYQDFQVIASQSTMQLKGKNVDLKDLGRDLDGLARLPIRQGGEILPGQAGHPKDHPLALDGRPGIVPDLDADVTLRE